MDIKRLAGTRLRFSATTYQLSAAGNKFLGDIEDHESLEATIAACQAVEGVTDWIVLRNYYRYEESSGRWDFIRCELADTSLPRMLSVEAGVA